MPDTTLPAPVDPKAKPCPTCGAPKKPEPVKEDRHDSGTADGDLRFG